MPTITLSKKSLQAACTKKRTDEELKDRIAFMGTDLESIEGDDITVEIFPNRPDLLSQQGFNRAFASFVGEAKIPHYKAYKPRKDGRVTVEAAVKNVRPYTACAIVRNLHLSDERIKEAIQIQEKLHVTYGRNRKRCAIGIYPLEHISLPITYTAKKPEEIRFQPLESKRTMTGLQILSQHPTGREYGHLLEGKALYPLFIDAKGDVLSMPPIINSEKTGKITEKTREVFIECSGFSWYVVHGALCMIVTALSDMGGQIEEMDVQYGRTKRTSPELKPQEMHLPLMYAERYLGYALTHNEAKKLLARMNIGTKPNKNKRAITALLPAYRTDIIHAIDLVEDLAIAYGMENVESQTPHVATIGREDPLEAFAAKVRDILAGLGLLEAKAYNLTSKEEQSNKIGLPEEDLVQVAASNSQEYDTLRKRILPTLLSVLSRNKHHEYPQELFEIGETFTKDPKTETGVQERKRLAVALCADDAGYTKARQVLDALLEAVAIQATMHAHTQAFSIPGRSAEILIKGKPVGHVGEVAPSTLENFGLEVPVAAFEIDLEALYEALDKDVKF